MMPSPTEILTTNYSRRCDIMKVPRWFARRRVLFILGLIARLLEARMAEIEGGDGRRVGEHVFGKGAHKGVDLFLGAVNERLADLTGDAAHRG
jgi:hypothetical protein